MRRIAIVGCGGSGKSTLAAKLGKRLDLPVYHLDRLFWKSGWIESSRDEWHETHRRICAEPEWIIDGNYSSTMDSRFKAADTVIFFDLSRYACLAGAWRRYMRFRGSTRPDMTEGCPEKLDREYIRWIWDFRRNQRPLVLEKIADLGEGSRVVVFKTRSEVTEWLKELECVPAND